MRINVLTIWREEISMMLPEMSDMSGGDGVTSQGAIKPLFRKLLLTVGRGASKGVIRADVLDLAHVEPDRDNLDEALL